MMILSTIGGATADNLLCCPMKKVGGGCRASRIHSISHAAAVHKRVTRDARRH